MALTKFLSNLVINGANGTVLDVQGSVGQLFSVTDSLTGDLFAVSDISGIPILNVNSSGAVDIDGTLNLGDSDKIQLGASQDLQIYHDGTNSYISEVGTGDLIISADNDLTFKDGSGNIMANMNASNSVELMYGNSKKFETTSAGVAVTGDLTVTGTDIRTGSDGQLSLGDDSSVLSIGRGNEMWTQNSVNAAATLYVNYRGYNGGSTQFRSLDIRDGKAGQIANFNGSDKSVSFAGNVGVTGTIGASNFSGSSSGTNTGDQTLPTLSSLGALSASGGTMTGDLNLGDNQLVFSNTNVAAPSTTDTGAGTRILLYSPGGEGNHYAIGIESNNMWFNSDVGYKWYRDSSAVMTLDSSSNLDVTGAVTTGGKLTIGTVAATSTATTALFLGAANEVKKRSLGSNAFNSTAFSTATGVSDNADVTPSWVPDSDPNYLTAHPNISAATSVDNSARTYIQDITLDSNGHVTGIASATETVTNTDTNYYLNGITKSGNTLTFAVSGATDQTYTFGSNAFNSTAYSTASGVEDNADVTPSWVPATDPSYLTSINNGNWSGTDLSVANGGTGASTAAAARTNLGLGSAATTASTDYISATSADTAAGLITFASGISTDGNSKFYNWRALNNSSNSNNSYWKIADISGADQSSRFIVTIAGRSTSYSDGTLPAMGHIVGQLNNDSNWDLVFYNHSTASSEVVTEVAIVDDGVLGVELWIKTGNYAEITASGHISDGSFTVNSNASSDGFTTSPDGYTVVTEYTSYNSGNTTLGTAAAAASTDFAAASHSHSAATTSAAGFMSSGDKTKLDGVATGADVTPSWVPGTDPNYLTSETFGSSDVVVSLGGTDVTAGESITLAGGLSYSGTTLTSANDNTTYTAGTGLTLTGTEFSVTANTYAAASHTHAATDITSGTLDIARIPTVDSKVSEFIENKHIYQRSGSVGVYLPMVKGGLYATSTSSITGQLKIKLPSYKTAMMISFHVDVYEYNTHRQQSYLVSGYAYNDTSATWYNTSAICLSDSDNRNLIVRFYSDTEAGEQYVTIGEADSNWVYPQVVVRDVMGGYNTSISELNGTWGISFIEENPGTSHAAHSDNHPIIDHSRIFGTLTVSQGGTGGTTAAAARTNLGAAGTSAATTSANGLMSSTDKTKLDGIEASADVTDTANVVAALTAGTNVQIAANGTISATDTNTTYSTSDFDAAGSADAVQSNLDSVAANVAGISNQSNTDVDTGTETIAQVSKGTYTAAFFDFVIKNGTNVRAGTVYSCHDGTNVEFTETSTVDLGDTSDVSLSVDISGTNMRLRATTTSNNWSVKSLVRAI